MSQSRDGKRSSETREVYADAKLGASPGDDPARSEEERLLETVLQETLVATSAKEAAQWIESFARRVSFDDISDPANAEELIREILGKRLVGWNLPGWLPRRVAEIFLEDPIARSRLIALWGEARRNVR